MKMEMENTIKIEIFYKCKECGEIKKPDKMTKRKCNGEMRVYLLCQACKYLKYDKKTSKEMGAKYYQKNKEKVSLKNKKYREKHRAEINKKIKILMIKIKIDILRMQRETTTR